MQTSWLSQKSICTLGIFFLLASLAPSSLVASETLRVVIDPGHGGTDDGAVRAGVREADIVLQVSLLLEMLLKQDEGFEVWLTRREDRNLNLEERVHFSELVNADILVSIHANASEDPRARGPEFYFQNQLPPSEEALYLAARENDIYRVNPAWRSENEADVQSIIEDLQRQSRVRMSGRLSRSFFDTWENASIRGPNAIAQAPFYLVSKASMPSVLVELGFISNPRERAQLTDPDHQRRLAQQLYEGLRRYKQIIDKGRPLSLD